jgi:CheY-like chemotaxis protein
MADDRRAEKVILLVEDYDDNRDMMRHLLEMAGHCVVEAENGLEAVEVAGRLSPDLILMDLRMPVLDGIEAIRLIRRSEGMRHVPVIIVSGDAPLSREVFLELDELGPGRIEYMLKPVDGRELTALADKMLGTRAGETG